jgi:hypothetical protein
VSVEAAAELGVCVPVFGVPSSLDGSGVVGLLFWLLKFGRKSEVKEGEGGKGVGGLL